MTADQIDALSIYADRYAEAPPSLGQTTFPGRYAVEAQVRLPRTHGAGRYWAHMVRLRRIDALAPGGVVAEVLIEVREFLVRFHVVGSLEGLEE